MGDAPHVRGKQVFTTPDYGINRIDPGANFTALGNKGTEFQGLEVFPNPGNAIIRMTTDEVTSLCPITGQPDFEVVDITYTPREKCVESKSLKLFLYTLRNEGAFVEALAMQIALAIFKATEPYWVRVDVTQKPRGGVSIVGVAVLHRDAHAPEGYQVGAPLVPTDPPFNHYLGH